MNGLITTIQRMSLHDGDGIRSTLFLKGCNFRCQWCHNPETWRSRIELQYVASRCIGCYDCVESCSNSALTLRGGTLEIDRGLCSKCGSCVESCPSGALSLVGRVVSPRQIVDELLVDKLFFDESGGGVTISGGEPFMQPRFLAEVVDLCKERGLNVAIETNLSCDKRLLWDIVSQVDHWFVDLKSMDDTLHQQWTGASNQTTLSNLEFLAHFGVSLTVRTPVIMGFNDNHESIEAICDFLDRCSIRSYQLLPFHCLGFDKFTQLGYDNPLSGDSTLDKSLFAALKEYAATRMNK